MTKFSVLMAIHGGDDSTFLIKSLESIWDFQSVRPSEVVIVVDGPLSYKIDQVLNNWQEKLGSFLVRVQLPKNKGLGAALCLGLEACTFELVARMDADDIALKDRFAVQLEILKERGDIDVLGSYVEEITVDGQVLGLRKMPIDHDSIISSLWASPIVHPTVMMHRSRILLAGNYDPTYRRRQDYELWFRCAKKGLRFHNHPQPLLQYRFGAHTHKKQSPKLALEQALIGYRGARNLRMPLYQRGACFVPFIRSLLPNVVQHRVYKLLKPFDPRQKDK